MQPKGATPDISRLTLHSSFFFSPLSLSLSLVRHTPRYVRREAPSCVPILIEKGLAGRPKTMQCTQSVLFNLIEIEAGETVVVSDFPPFSLDL